MARFAPKDVLQELAKRKRAMAGVVDLITSIRAELFDKQLAFLDDTSRNKAALCTRRAGKTSMWVRYATIEALKQPRALIRIWAVNRLRAKQLLWEEFRYLFQRHKASSAMVYAEKHMHETELTIKFENGSEIRLLGADKDKEAQKKRGDKTVMEVIVEAQLFGPYLKTLVEEVAEPCLFDLKGTFCLEGTPGPLCVGYWFEVSGREDELRTWQSPGGKEGVGAGWACHRWSVLDNPFLPDAAEELAKLKKKRRWGDDNPTFIREWLGKWVNDFSALFYRFSESRNTFSLAEVQPWGPGWQHVLGWDLGYRDDMALVVWGWHPDKENLYEAFSWKKPGALAEEVMAQISALRGRGFNFIAMVADTGGGGRMYVEEVMSRYSEVFEAAKKTEKYEHVRMFNNDMLTGHVKLMKGSVYAEELAGLPTDPDWPDPEAPEAPPREDPRFPNHCADSGLYSWRRAYHFIRDRQEVLPAKGTPERHQKDEEAILEKLAHGSGKKEWWEPESEYTDDLGGMDGFV